MRFSLTIVLSAVFLSGLSVVTRAQQSEVTLRFFNGATEVPLQQHQPEQDIIYRVELPSQSHIEAVAPDAKSAVFSINGEEYVIDSAAPFLLEQFPRQPFMLQVKTYSQADGKGEELAVKKQKINISGLGMPAAAMTEIEHDAWLAANLDKVLSRKVFTSSNGTKMPYRLFVPPDYSPKVRYPLLVFLHGRGQRGNDNSAAMFEDVGLFTGAQSVVSPSGQTAFPSLVLVPQCSDESPDEEWAKWIGNSPERPFDGLGLDGTYLQADKPSSSGAAAIELLESLASQYNVDRERIYLTGISMGGFGTWDLTTRRPDLFAAAVPMAGYVDPSKAGKLEGIPFWIFHGSQDEFNPVAGSRRMYEQLKAAGNPVKFTEIEGAKHNESFQIAWQNAQILPWMFAQTKQP